MKTTIAVALILLLSYPENYSLSITKCSEYVKDIQCPLGVGADNCVAFVRKIYPCLPHGLDTAPGKADLVRYPLVAKRGFVAITKSTTKPELGHLGIVVGVDEDSITLAQGGGGCQIRSFSLDCILGYWSPDCDAAIDMDGW